MATEKMTNKKALEYVLENMEIPADVRERLTAMLTSLEKKSSGGNRKPTAKQLENETFKAEIMEMFESKPDAIMSCGDVKANVPNLVELDISTARVSSMLVQLKGEGKITVTVEKRKNYYQLAKGEMEEVVEG